MHLESRRAHRVVQGLITRSHTGIHDEWPGLGGRQEGSRVAPHNSFLIWFCTSAYGEVNYYSNTHSHTHQPTSQQNQVTLSRSDALTDAHCSIYIFYSVGVCVCVCVCVQIRLAWWNSIYRVKQTHTAYSICFPCWQTDREREREG